MTHPGVIFGAASIGHFDGSLADSADRAESVFDLLRTHSVRQIDTSRHYPNVSPGSSEQVLGQTELAGFTIDTKVLSSPGEHSINNLQKSIKGSLDALRVKKVNILYLHWPDTETPLETVCKGMNEIYKQGLFERFGISNYTIPQVNEILEICEKQNYVKPTVYQGAYNALTRNIEQELLPLLRANNISYYAYSAAAGGIFNRSSTRLNGSSPLAQLMKSQYGSESISAAINKVSEAGIVQGLTGHTIALRWILHHSAMNAAYGDKIIIGARTAKQLKETLQSCDGGPLPQDLVRLVEQAWDQSKEDAPPYTLWAKKEGEKESAMDKFMKTMSVQAK